MANSMAKPLFFYKINLSTCFIWGCVPEPKPAAVVTSTSILRPTSDPTWIFRMPKTAIFIGFTKLKYPAIEANCDVEKGIYL